MIVSFNEGSPIHFFYQISNWPSGLKDFYESSSHFAIVTSMGDVDPLTYICLSTHGLVQG